MKISTRYEYEMKDMIRTICIKQRYFTCGSNEQYYKMFDCSVSPEFSCRDIAMMIYCCSSKDKDYKSILKDITKAHAEVKRWEKQDAEEDF